MQDVMIETCAPHKKEMMSLQSLTEVAKWLYSKVVKFLRRHITGKHKKRAGGIVVNEKEEILLVSSRKNPDMWILPAGTIEYNESAPEAALREVCEEAGVVCVIKGKVGIFCDEISVTSTAIFLMTVLKDRGVWEYKHCGRKRQWFSANDALPNLKPRDRSTLNNYLKQQKETTTFQR